MWTSETSWVRKCACVCFFTEIFSIGGLMVSETWLAHLHQKDSKITLRQWPKSTQTPDSHLKDSLTLPPKKLFISPRHRMRHPPISPPPHYLIERMSLSYEKNQTTYLYIRRPPERFTSHQNKEWGTPSLYTSFSSTFPYPRCNDKKEDVSCLDTHSHHSTQARL